MSDKEHGIIFQTVVYYSTRLEVQIRIHRVEYSITGYIVFFICTVQVFLNILPVKNCERAILYKAYIIEFER